LLKQKNNNEKVNIMLMNLMRELWEQHGFWTRSFIVSAVDGLADLELVTKRLLRNPADFAAVLKNFYGEQNANKFNELLTAHLTIAADMVNNAKAGNMQKYNELKKDWFRNADEIAVFLSSINPYWNRSEWQKMLYNHLNLVEAEAVTRLNRQYEENIAIFDEIQNQALTMADYMSSGIMKQFGSQQ
jgi:hypothetical protein